MLSGQKSKNCSINIMNHQMLWNACDHYSCIQQHSSFEQVTQDKNLNESNETKEIQVPLIYIF